LFFIVGIRNVIVDLM